MKYAVQQWRAVYEGPIEKARAIRDDLRGSGIKARYAHSPYVGHCYVEAANTPKRKLASVLGRAGYKFQAQMLRRGCIGSEF